MNRTFEFTDGRWPVRPLVRVPGQAEAAALANGIRSLALTRRESKGPVDLDRVCRAARAEVRVTRLSAAEGMREALLVPLEGDRFGITVDPTPRGGWSSTPEPLRASLRRHRLRFRVGHELAHCLAFWRSRGRPKRHLYDSPEQEEFCDRFSSFLLVPQERAAAVSPTAEGLLSLQGRFDVSLQVAARALSNAQPDLTVALWFRDSQGELRSQWSSACLPAAAAERAETLATSGSPLARWLPERRQLVLVSDRSGDACA